MEFSQAQLHSLDNMGNGMLGSVGVSNGVKSSKGDCIFAVTISGSNEYFKSHEHNILKKKESNVRSR